MGRKTNLLISTAFCITVGLNGLGSLSAFAEESPIAKDYWTFSEAKELGILRSHHFGVLITSINPHTNKISLYQDAAEEDFMELEEDFVDHVTSFYLAWYDNGADEPMTDFSWIDIGRPYFVRDFQNGTPSDGTHFILEASDAADGAKWLPLGEEKEFSSIEDLSKNERSRIWYTAYYGTADMITGTDYSSCTSSPDYKEGMSCKLVFTKSGAETYLPFAEDGKGSATSESTTGEKLAKEEIIEEGALRTPEDSAPESHTSNPTSASNQLATEAPVSSGAESDNRPTSTEAKPGDSSAAAAVASELSGEDRGKGEGGNATIEKIEPLAVTSTNTKEDNAWHVIILAILIAAFATWWLIPAGKNSKFWQKIDKMLDFPTKS